MALELKSINGFESPSEYNRFLQFLDEQVVLGNLQEIDVDPKYTRGTLTGGRWFKETLSGSVWRLIPHDYPFRGLWEPVTK